ncbi:hypothetical protein Pst134EA_013956 [Puccinia striiformis f. sp. tritici]|uniref:hypothetical protein n=1 Tax=Puccinia striiformis f. sp. tritici TaxID=168172 RepID=UPI0020085A34|nr:hypothetical protein Pst134EA_013956 [Puccinia striiformis f. sp. tritici]KAH9466113.1 hypothetical protein Pst134EA_013956 [Puccinia striiformis f. sp. tritici]
MLALFKLNWYQSPIRAERLEIIKELFRKDFTNGCSNSRQCGTEGVEQLASAGIQLMAKDMEKALGKARSNTLRVLVLPVPKVKLG